MYKKTNQLFPLSFFCALSSSFFFQFQCFFFFNNLQFSTLVNTRLDFFTGILGHRIFGVEQWHNFDMMLWGSLLHVSLHKEVSLGWNSCSHLLYRLSCVRSYPFSYLLLNIWISSGLNESSSKVISGRVIAPSCVLSEVYIGR